MEIDTSTNASYTSACNAVQNTGYTIHHCSITLLSSKTLLREALCLSGRLSGETVTHFNERGTKLNSSPKVGSLFQGKLRQISCILSSIFLDCMFFQVKLEKSKINLWLFCAKCSMLCETSTDYVTTGWQTIEIVNATAITKISWKIMALFSIILHSFFNCCFFNKENRWKKQQFILHSKM